MTLGIFSSDFGRSSSKRFPIKWLFPAVTSPIQTVIVKLKSAWPSRRRAARESAANVLKCPPPPPPSGKLSWFRDKKKELALCQHLSKRTRLCLVILGYGSQFDRITTKSMPSTETSRRVGPEHPGMRDGTTICSFCACLQAARSADRGVSRKVTFFFPCLALMFLFLLRLGAATTAFGFSTTTMLVCHPCSVADTKISYRVNLPERKIVPVRVICVIAFRVALSIYKNVLSLFHNFLPIVFTLLATVERPLVKFCERERMRWTWIISKLDIHFATLCKQETVRLRHL